MKQLVLMALVITTFIVGDESGSKNGDIASTDFIYFQVTTSSYWHQNAIPELVAKTKLWLESFPPEVEVTIVTMTIVPLNAGSYKYDHVGVAGLLVYYKQRAKR